PPRVTSTNTAPRCEGAELPKKRSWFPNTPSVVGRLHGEGWSRRANHAVAYSRRTNPIAKRAIADDEARYERGCLHTRGLQGSRDCRSRRYHHPAFAGLVCACRSTPPRRWKSTPAQRDCGNRRRGPEQVVFL